MKFLYNVAHDVVSHFIKVISVKMKLINKYSIPDEE